MIGCFYLDHQLSKDPRIHHQYWPHASILLFQVFPPSFRSRRAINKEILKSEKNNSNCILLKKEEINTQRKVLPCQASDLIPRQDRRSHRRNHVLYGYCASCQILYIEADRRSHVLYAVLCHVPNSLDTGGMVIHIIIHTHILECSKYGM